jgi:hypothetical protein
MTSKSKPTSRLWRTVCSSLLFLLAIFPLDRAAAQGLPLCSWPFEVTGRGLTNVATPDTNATYWVTPLDTNRWSTAIIDGRYPNARFFNLSTYEAAGSLVDSVIDASIKPAVGMNPFTANCRRARIIVRIPTRFGLAAPPPRATICALEEVGWSFLYTGCMRPIAPTIEPEGLRFLRLRWLLLMERPVSSSHVPLQTRTAAWPI